MKHIFAILLILVGIPGMASGQDVTAHVDRTRMATGESARLSVTVAGQNAADVDTSPIVDFRVISQGTSSSINIVNGRTTSKVVYNYTIIPLKTGRLKIPSLPVRVDGIIHKTEPIDIFVTKQPQADPEQSDIFVTAEVSNSSPYSGEQIIYRFRLYSAVRIANAGFKELPDFSGFSAKQVEQKEAFQTILGGRKFIVNEVVYVLMPLSEGEKTIERAILSCDVAVRRKDGQRDSFGSIFNDPFFRGMRYETRIFQSKPVDVSVRPLPEPPPDVSFTGLVGHFQLRTELENREMKVGDSATLSVTIRGVGNIMDAGEPAIDVPEEFKTYQDTPEEEITVGLNGYQGKKIFRKALVPLKPGDFTIDPVEIAYFKIPEGEYRILSDSPISVHVSPAEEKKPMEVYSGNDEHLPKSLKRKVEFTGRDILPLKEGMDVLKNRRPLSIPFYAALIFVPAFIFIVLYAMLAVFKKTETPGTIMAERADKAIRDACRQDLPQVEFVSRLYCALVSSILAKADVKGETLTAGEVETILKSRGYSDEIADEACKILTDIESARFGGMEMDSGGRSNLFEKTRNIIRTLK